VFILCQVRPNWVRVPSQVFNEVGVVMFCVLVTSYYDIFVHIVNLLLLVYYAVLPFKIRVVLHVFVCDDTFELEDDLECYVYYIYRDRISP